MGKRPLLWVFLLTAFLIFVCGRAGGLTCPPPPFSKGERVVLYGTVEEIIQKENSRQIRLSKVWIPSDLSYQRQVLVNENQGNLLKIGYRVKAEGEYCPLEPAGNPGQFDQKAYYEAQGVGMILKKARITVERKTTAYVRQGLYELRIYLGEILNKIAGEEEAAVFSAMLLGEKSQLKTEQKELYQSGGISHILAISGLHISLLGMLLYRGLRKWKRSYPFCAAVSGSFMVVYGYFVGFGVSAKRAILMFLVYLGAEVLGESYDVVSSLSFVGILILLKEPRQLFQCGFQLSFLSVGAVGLVYPALKKQIKGKALDNLLLGLSVTGFTLPCTLFWFYECMPYGILLNLLVIPLVPAVFLSGLAGMLLGCFWTTMGSFFIGPGAGVLKLFQELLLLAKQLPNSRLIIGQPKLWKIAVYYALVTAAVFFHPEKRMGREKEKKTVQRMRCVGKNIIRLGVICASLLLLCHTKEEGARIVFLDVGQGDGIFFQTEKGTTCMIDGGSSTVSKVGTYRILPFLKSQGVSHLDYLFLTHMDEDHVNGARELLENQSGGVTVGTLCLTDRTEEETRKELEQTAKKFGTAICLVSKGTHFSEEGFGMECLYPVKGGKGEDKNENSMVLLADFAGRRVLFTGDLEGAGEAELLTLGCSLKADILKVAHHGSKGATGEAFLEKISPRISVISSGEGNRYGHPASELLRRLVKSGTTIYRTDAGGAILVKFEENGIRVEEFCPQITKKQNRCYFFPD